MTNPSGGSFELYSEYLLTGVMKRRRYPASTLLSLEEALTELFKWHETPEAERPKGSDYALWLTRRAKETNRERVKPMIQRPGEAVNEEESEPDLP